MSNREENLRTQFVERLRGDLIGPLDTNEILGLGMRPTDTYLTGILWPIGERMGAEDDDGGSADSEDGIEDTSSGSVVGAQRPCSMGLSFAISSARDQPEFEVKVSFGTYSPVQDGEDSKSRATRWQRRDWRFSYSVDCRLDNPRPIRIENSELTPTIELQFRAVKLTDSVLITVTLINLSSFEIFDRNEAEQHTLFQTKLVISALNNSRLVPRPGIVAAHDEDQLSAQLLYRSCKEFATGHQCSVSWGTETAEVQSIVTSWIPESLVPAYKENGDELFSPFISSGFCDAEVLANSDHEKLVTGLMALPEAYGNWISTQELEAENTEGALRERARHHIELCRLTQKRISNGIENLRTDPNLCLAFRLANLAMSVQHSWKTGLDGEKLSSLRWRPFQLGFIILALTSTCIGDDIDRDTLDLLWFPTGGGKTEAYLTLIAAASWYRRITRENPDNGAGNVAVMRYTLRLLTSQQFERASSLILACELIRRKRIPSALDQQSTGKVPFSIGLWVGGDATPNDYEKASQMRNTRGGTSAEQLSLCPSCGSSLNYHYDESQKIVRAHCKNHSCLLGPDFGYWPVHTVDDDIYRSRPTLLIGTVDKFAQLPFRSEINQLFGFGTSSATDLIIQDELHLISGPLGTLTGLYETAFDWLLRKAGVRPKIIGSTATIRRAAQQVRALFDRGSHQFPPPGLSFDNSGFAVVDYDNVSRWRLYVGVTTAGRSAKFALQAVAGSLLQSGGKDSGFSDSERDGYSTLLCYFNSLRELGGAIVQMLDDVPDSVKLFASRRDENGRAIGVPQELTSRVSQKEIVKILSELRRGPPDPDAVDVVLATNMVSVGVDVPRLGLMLVNGQPKTRSEYIQATSRVGRSTYPGIVVSVLNAQKARDRSHFETFQSWHASIYRDVEATSVTPFASRARDRALRAVLVSMIRHGVSGLLDFPKLDERSMPAVSYVIEEIERRVTSIDQRELSQTRYELDDAMRQWLEMNPEDYRQIRGSPKTALTQTAEDYAKKVSAGKSIGHAWPLMNTMRSVEPGTRFRLVETLTVRGTDNHSSGEDGAKVPLWRKR